ncbi:hypothetical protein LSH36_629g01064 [Paralvinella palmiformis]|uniref:CWF19-like protein 1 n=1 Tax=Paralvinella palmiformis TaxID=53620 RepID=A0AAD9J3V1_9ANNE|nr:hypothetical protein LSH36_629g01064 [Paralvinella palmiformis]
MDQGLVSGDVEGHFSQLFSRVSTIQKKAGPFDMLLCVGSFFGSDRSSWESYTTGNNKVPIPMLVLGPNSDNEKIFYDDLDGCELCDNVTYLGKKGIYTSSNGLKVAYLSGTDPKMQSDSPEICFSQNDVCALTVSSSSTSFKGVDLLLTSQWPRGVEKYGIKAEGVNTKQVGSETISQVAIAMKPRYHFCAMEGVFYERLPYRNHKVLQESAQHTTRFIALAKVGNPKKSKFLYAFNITPMCDVPEVDLTKQPSDVTECPYSHHPSLLLPQDQMDQKPAQFFYDQKMLDKKTMGEGKRKSQEKKDWTPRKQAKPTGPCWFCLGSAEVEKHLVVSVGSQCYLALAKGGLTDDHVLILPIGHYQSTVSAPSEIIDEIDKYKTALRKFFKSHNKSVIFYERNYKTQHLQIQAVPIPLDLSDQIKDTFEGCALCQNMELHEIPKLSDLKQIVPEGAPYFYVELPSGDKLLYRISKGFPLNFGREAVADQMLLNLPQRVDWRNCKLSKDEETQHAKTFRTGFQKYDFNV